MPWRSRLIASTRSSRSVVSVVVLGLDLAQLLLGAQVDGAEPLALAAQLVELGLDVGDVGQRLRRARCSASAATAVGLDLQHLVDLVRDVGEAALGALEPLLGAGGVLARGAERFERGAGGAVGARPARFSASASRSAAARRVGFGRLDLADQRGALLGEQPPARRRARRARSSASSTRCVERRDLGGGAVAARGPACALGRRSAARRRAASSASRASACASARTSASVRAVAFDLAAHGGEPLLDARRTAASAASACSASLRARRRPRRGWRPAAPWPRSSAERRAALRPTSRSAAACRSRAACGRALQLAPAASRAAVSAAAAARLRPAAALDRRCAWPRRRLRAVGQFGLDVGEAVLARRAGAPRRSAHWRRPRSRPSATDRRRATPAAGRA